MNEVHINDTTGNDIWFVRYNTTGQVALSNGNVWETWGAGGHTIANYRVAALEVGTGSGHYVGSFDASGNITHADVRTYYLVAYRKVAAVYNRVSEGFIIWNGTSEVEFTALGDIMNSADLYAALNAYVATGGDINTIKLGVSHIGSDTDSIIATLAGMLTATTLHAALNAYISTGGDFNSMLKILRADKVIDITKTPWVVDYFTEGTTTKLMSKTLKNTAGLNITSDNNVLGRLEKET